MEGKAKAIVVSVVLMVLGLLIGLNIISGSSTNLTDAGDSITDANNCSEHTDSSGAAWGYNITSKRCYNLTSAGTNLANQYDLPLNTLFSSNGVALIIFMVAVFLGFVGFIIVRARMKG